MRRLPLSRLTWLLAVALLAISQPCLAAQTGAGATSTPAQAAVPAPSPGTWTVNASDQYCSVGRTTQDPVPITFSVRTVPGSRFAELIIHNPQWRRAPLAQGQPARIIAKPSGAAFEGEPRARRLRNGDALLVFTRLPLDFLDSFANSTEIQVDQQAQTLVRFSFRQAARAISPLRTCIASTLRDWAVDQARLDSLSSRPVETAPWLTSDDYPVDSLRNNETGQVVVRLAISESGRVTACNVVGSSGHERLDEATCNAARMRARYSPAIDAGGNPVAVTMIETTMFEIMQ